MSQYLTSRSQAPLSVRWRAALHAVNTRGVHGLDELIALYADDMVFIDSIQELHGRDAYRAMNQRLLGRVRALQVNVTSVLGDDRELMAVGTMTVQAKVGAQVTVHGAMHMRTRGDGQIVYQRDYMDLATSILDGIPMIGPIYRKAVVKLLG